MGGHIYIILSVSLCVVLAQKDYCVISPAHTLCQYLDYGRNCGASGPIFRGLHEEEKKIVVEMHNRHRSRVAQGREGRGSPGPQKPASNMLELTWDSELELIAQRWADQCDFGHDSERSVNRFSVGQNVYEASEFNEGPMDLKRAIDGWYNEVDSVNNKVSSRYQFIPGTGHYTQIVWANTYKIGCGFTAFRKRNFIKKYLVCNYGDAGNILGAEMYKTGRPCSRCPANICSRRFPGLCPVPGEKSFAPSNASFVQIVDINNDVESINPSDPEGNVESFRPVFVDTNDIEEFNPPRPQVSRPVQQQLRPIASSIDPDLFVFSARPSGGLRPNILRPNGGGTRNMFERFFGNLFG